MKARNSIYLDSINRYINAIINTTAYESFCNDCIVRTRIKYEKAFRKQLDVKTSARNDERTPIPKIRGSLNPRYKSYLSDAS